MSMSGYTKLFNSILASTIWREDDKTRILWITMLAMAGKDGVVEASVPGLADLARISIDDVLRGLEKLKAPDEFSRSREFDGKRIADTEGGWLILNHAKYRKKLSEDDKRQYNAAWMRQYRQSQKSTHSTCGECGDKQKQMQIADAKEDADTKEEELRRRKRSNQFVPPSLEEVQAEALEIGLEEIEAEKFFNHFESNGWKVSGKTPMKSWPAALKGWKLRSMPKGHKPDQQAKPEGKSLWELKTLLETTTAKRDELRQRHRAEVAGGSFIWDSPESKEEVIKLNKIIKELENNILSTAGQP